MFKGSQQQDAQEFLRCLLTQIHEEMGIQVPQSEEGCGHKSCDHRDSMVSFDSDTSGDSHSSQSRLVSATRNSPLTKIRSSSSSSLPRIKLTGSTHNSPSCQSKLSKYSKIISTSSAKSSVESIPTHLTGSKVSLEPQEGVVEWAEGDVFVADLTDRRVTVHKNYLSTAQSRISHDQDSSNQITSPEAVSPTVSGEMAVESSIDEDPQESTGGLPTTPPASGGGTSRGETEKINCEPATETQNHTETQAPPIKVEAPPTSRSAGE